MHKITVGGIRLAGQRKPEVNAITKTSGDHQRDKMNYTQVSLCTLYQQYKKPPLDQSQFSVVVHSVLASSQIQRLRRVRDNEGGL